MQGTLSAPADGGDNRDLTPGGDGTRKVAWRFRRQSIHFLRIARGDGDFGSERLSHRATDAPGCAGDELFLQVLNPSSTLLLDKIQSGRRKVRSGFHEPGIRNSELRGGRC